MALFEIFNPVRVLYQKEMTGANDLNSICSRIKFTWQGIKSETVFAGGENPGLGDSGGADED